MGVDNRISFFEVPVWTLFRYRHSTFLKLNERYVLRLRRREEPDKGKRGVFRLWHVGKWWRDNRRNPRGMRAGTLVEPGQKK